MFKLYHGVPEEMVGHVLKPLSSMKDTHPDLEAKYRKKYEGREEVSERKVPLLNCSWDDVVQFMPLNPRKVFELQLEMGIIPEVPEYNFFEINLEDFDTSKAVVFFKTAPGDKNVVVKWFDDVDKKSLLEIPPATIEYYKNVAELGELPFNYQFIPHVLFLGELNISKAKIFSLNC